MSLQGFLSLQREGKDSLMVVMEHFTLLLIDIHLVSQSLPSISLAYFHGLITLCYLLPFNSFN